MQRLQAAIDRYNVVRARIWDDDYNTLLPAGAAAGDQIARLQALEPRRLPDDLLDFYRQFGGLGNEGNTESYCLQLPAPSELADGLQQADAWRIRSLGLIDMILHSWGNSRPEFEPGRFFTLAAVQGLNQRYRCFGWYRTDTVLESAWYLYADEDGRFGALFYDQDAFEATRRELLAMFAASPARQSLEQALCEGRGSGATGDDRVERRIRRRGLSAGAGCCGRGLSPEAAVPRRRDPEGKRRD